MSITPLDFRSSRVRWRASQTYPSSSPFRAVYVSGRDGSAGIAIREAPGVSFHASEILPWSALLQTSKLSTWIFLLDLEMCTNNMLALLTFIAGVDVENAFVHFDSSSMLRCANGCEYGPKGCISFPIRADDYCVISHVSHAKIISTFWTWCGRRHLLRLLCLLCPEPGRLTESK